MSEEHRQDPEPSCCFDDWVPAWEHKSKGFDQYGAPLPEPLEAELQLTWERVFDFELLRRAKIWGPADKIQGVTEYVLLDEVRRVTEFVSR